MPRKNKTVFMLCLGLLSTLSLAAKANTISEQHVVVAPQCLIKKLHTDYTTLSSTNTFSLISVNKRGINQLMIEREHAHACGGFRDVTRAWKEFKLKHGVAKEPLRAFLAANTNPSKPSLTDSASNYDIKYEKEVNELLVQLNPQTMWSDLISLTNFEDRYSNSANGAAASDWIAKEITNIAKNNNRSDVTVYKVKTGLYQQESVVAKVGDSSEPGVVIGAHMDTLPVNDVYYGGLSVKPGADDDGTGTVTVLEVARTLLKSDLRFKKPIYFIWYAAEEVGLVGSDHVVDDFKKKKIPVSAVVQLDMTGYAHRNDPTMWLMTDYVNKDLTAYFEKLITTYVNQPVKYSKCGYACSDHASWTLAGYAAAMPSEASFQTINPDIHTSKDTMEKLSLSHMKDYAKLAIAFAVELAEVAHTNSPTPLKR